MKGPGPFQPAIACVSCADGLDVGDVGVSDRGRRAVQRDATLLSQRGIAVDVAAIDDQIVRHLASSFCAGAAVAEPDDVAGAVRGRAELEELQPPVMGAGRRAERGSLFGDFSFASRSACAGRIRWPGARQAVVLVRRFGCDVALPTFAGRRKFPCRSRRRSSSEDVAGRARSIASWRSAPAEAMVSLRLAPARKTAAP